jgi:hypothetical protein
MKDDLRAAAGRLALISLAGLGLGLLVGGVLGRLAMFALIRLSPEAKGSVSDDDFVMGQFTLSGTLNLLFVGTVLGIVGAAVYAAVRWLQLPGLSLRIVTTAACAGVGFGALIVHRDGVDFTILEAGPAIVLFVALPATFGGLLAWVVESRLDQPTGGLRRTPVIVAGLAPFVLVVPVLPVFALAWGLGRLLDKSWLGRVLRSASLRWTGRVVASTAFLLLLQDLALDTAALT